MKRCVTVGVAFCVVAVLVLAAGVSRAAEGRKPNIVVIYADDLGYGDVGCYGATKVRTPEIDRLAAGGLRFTDAHASASTCTPSRYSILTGQYAWRKPGTHILPGDANLIIDPSKPTLASVLRAAGYTTAAIGKWHLGLGQSVIDWNREIAPGPRELGFDYSFLIPATGDRVPCVYVENQRVLNLDPSDPITVSYTHPVGDWPTGREHPEMLRMKLFRGHDGTIVNGVSRIGWMTGGKAALWDDETMAATLAGKAVGFMEQNKDRPFFLYLATHDIHVPRLPNKQFAGGSGCGVRGDVIEQLDWTVGQVMDALRRLNLTDETLVIFTSDNGPVVDDGYNDGALENLNGHKPAGPFRGGKYTSWEGGTREPFIVHWPGRVKPGVSKAMVCQIDLMASLGRLAGQKLSGDAGPDSFDVLPALLGDSPTGRQVLVEQGNMLSLRKGDWKLIAPLHAVAVDPETPRESRAAAAANAESGKSRPKKGGGKNAILKPMLFDLSSDIGEEHDLAAAHPEKVSEMLAELKAIHDQPMSRAR